MFKQMEGGGTCLRMMDLRCRDLSRIPADDIARAVTEANLIESKMTDNKILYIFYYVQKSKAGLSPALDI